ncbi:hypothetical protein EIP91_009139 [Steccherinum ochraceum]|uniref:F-box domain-containing protein n=1 Tax=Steccherinum ochraceum TaxID=92696 RepID=A0A4R0R7K4_9APHY|nr:hypothetical protein EIP91_009139 [Steccherinum ochraceum]
MEPKPIEATSSILRAAAVATFQIILSPLDQRLFAMFPGPLSAKPVPPMDWENLICAPQLAENIRLLSMVDPRYLSKDQRGARDLVATHADAAIDGCQRLIEECTRAMRIIGSKRNACSVMHWVPAEIIVEIIWNAMDPALGSVSLIQLANTSQKWRKVCLGTPKLWSRVIVDSTTHIGDIKTLLSRVDSYPLSVVMRTDAKGGGYSNVLAIMKLLFNSENMTRIRDLDLDICKGSLRLVKQLRSTSTAQFRSLAVNVEGCASGDPLRVFANGSPGLSTLRLKGRLPMAKQLARFAVGTVTVLTLKGSDANRVVLKASDFASALRSMPLLAQLDLCNVGMAVEKAPTGPTFIDLRHLKRASLEHTVDYILWFLEYVQFPHSAQISLNIGHTPASFSSCGQKITQILETQRTKGGRLDRRLTKLPSYSASLSMQERYYLPSFHLTLSVERTDFAAACAGHIEIITLHYSSSNIDALWRALPLSEVSVFSLQPGDASYSRWAEFPSHLASLANHLTAVETFRTSWPPEWLHHLNFLFTKTPGDNVTPQRDVKLVPRLHSVVFHAVQFGVVTLPLPTNNNSDKQKKATSPRAINRVNILRSIMNSWRTARGQDLSFSFMDCTMTDVEQRYMARSFETFRLQTSSG